MLFPLPSYSTVPVAKRVVFARVNDAGLVAGIRLLPEVEPPVSDESTSGPRPPVQREAFVWKEGKVLFHDPIFTGAGGPNARGEIALGGPGGLFLWKDGGLTRISDAAIATIAGVADDGSVLATLRDGRDPFNRTSSLIWPSNLTAEGRYRFGPEVPQGAKPTDAPSGAVTYTADGGSTFYRPSFSAGGGDGGTAVRTPNGVWWFGSYANQPVPHGLTRNGYGIVDGGGPARLWHNGDLLVLPGSDHQRLGGPLGSLHAVNGRGEAVGALDGHAVLYAGGECVDLNQAAGVPETFDAVAISENGNVLANAGATLYLLRRKE